MNKTNANTTTNRDDHGGIDASKTSGEADTPQVASGLAAPDAVDAPRGTRQRRMARPQDDSAQHGIQAGEREPATPRRPRPPSKLDALADLLCRTEGASLPEMMTATGWQAHSVRGAMAGALKARGFTITSNKAGDTRRWHAERPA